MKLISLLILLFSLPALSCEVSLPSHLIVVGEGQGVGPISFDKCNESFQNDLRDILSEVEGRLSSHQLTDLLKMRGHSSIYIEPNRVHVTQLKSLIREQLPLPAGIQIKSLKAVNGPNFISLAPGDRIEVNCSSCLYGSQQPLNIQIIGFDGVNRSFIVNSDFRKMVRAYRIISSINSFAEIFPQESLREEYVEAIPHTDLVTDLSVLKFYRSNKPLKVGELLKLADLNAVNLVKAGLKTEVILENQLVRIKTQGISRSNGSIGDLVEVFHPQKNKKYQGKVVDINKVLVEL
jgi:hypothetical protein